MESRLQESKFRTESRMRNVNRVICPLSYIFLQLSSDKNCITSQEPIVWTQVRDSARAPRLNVLYCRVGL